jgi:hypothetical protein
MPIDDATPQSPLDHQHPEPSSPHWPFYDQSPVIIWTLGLTTASLLAYGIFWLWLAIGLVHAIDDWVAAKTSSGVTASYASVKLGGFPLRVSAHLKSPRIESRLGQWQGDSLSVSFAPLSPDRVRLVFHGTDHVRVGDQSWDLSSAFIRTDLSFDPGKPPQTLRSFQITAGDLAVTGANALEASVEGFGLSVLPFAHHGTADYKTPWASFVVTMAGVRIGAASEGQGVAPMALLEASGRVMGAMHLDAPTNALTQWSKEGGVLELDRFVTDWPPVAVQGQGTLALDGKLQPLASFSTEFRGMGQFADGLERTGSIDRQAAAQLRTAFAGSAKTDGKGRTVLAVPLTVQDGKLWAGSVALAPLPEIRWP